MDRSINERRFRAAYNIPEATVLNAYVIVRHGEEERPGRITPYFAENNKTMDTLVKSLYNITGLKYTYRKVL